MISLLEVSEDAHGLVLAYPSWIAAAFAVVSLGLAAYAFVRRKRLARAWPVTLAVMVASWAGVYVATFRTTIDEQAGRAYAFLRFDHTVRWQDAADIYLERGGANDWQIVVIDHQHRAYNFDVADLPVEQRDRVMAYMVDRMPPSAFDHAPELLKRRSVTGARTVGLFEDQQI